MTLCSSRPDGGLGPYYTNGTTHVLTTCFDDVILEPLGSWVFLLFTGVLFLVMLRRRTADPNYLERQDIEMIPSESGLRPKPTLGSRTRTILCWGGKWPKTRLALLIIDDFLLVAILAMQILEVARLAVDGQGVGLLPFTFIPPIIILVSTHIPTPAWIKLASYGKVKKLIGEAVYNGVDSKYPYSDRLIDNIVLVCLYWSFLQCYIHQVVLEYIRYEWGVFP
ncbi:hypothetical protein EHS25_004327 [Saitozyma podzolica]|uniref:Uncharacterized protein n=1 Tax=Saitozyma podzolica TaxID=1890683 RepID=A0A427YTQ3_9TREE|nr:hypothetical protein EHS25_004327 [Saitozyma podzolica]